MFAQLILERPPEPSREAIITPNKIFTWAELHELGVALQTKLAGLEGRRVGISFDCSGPACAALAALDHLRCDTFLLESSLSLAEMLKLAAQFQLGALVIPDGDPSEHELVVHELEGEAKATGQSTVTILTSGSSGKPKAVRHSWAGLSRPIRKASEHAGQRWLLTYRPHLYAGMQVILQCLANYGTLVKPAHDADPADVARLSRSARVEFASATPSFWRRMLILCDRARLAEIPLRQLTLGGEIVDQTILDELRQTFPDARIVHIYATTELGRCFSVTDGIAGFPVSFLDEVSADGVHLKVENGMLFARSANTMLGYDPLSGCHSSERDWFETGDLVEINGNRVEFIGRSTDTVNVGGRKVNPFEIESVIRAIPGVADARVFGKASSIMGQVVACEVVPEAGQNPDSLREMIIRSCRSKLSPVQQPRFIQIVANIDLSKAGKTVRGMAQ
jgi:acyl-coenzyme A synthetase/AMP-(fatty) acid ligase